MSEKGGLIFAIESSCDETAAALVRSGPAGAEVLVSLIASQIEVHRRHGGVVPELASRNHSLHLPGLMKACLNKAGVEFDEVDGVAATAGPGLASSLLVGMSGAKGLALASGKPFYAINHLEGHLLSPFLGSGRDFEPNLSLVVSGGHTLLVDCAEVGAYDLMGKSRDDAAGEAFDKVGKMLGLPYPGGPEVEKQALSGDPKAFNLPRSMMQRGELDFSFSGLKTAVLYALPGLYERYRNERGGSENKLLAKDLADMSASFQRAVIEVLVKKTMRAARASGRRIVTISGGVSCNKVLRESMQQACRAQGLELLLPSPKLSTDNAAMIAYAGLLRHERGLQDSFEVDIDPNLPLTANSNRAKVSRQHAEG